MSELENIIEERLMTQLKSLGYTRANEIKTYADVERNFKIQIGQLNRAIFKTKPITDTEIRRVINHLDGKNVYESAKILRDQFELEREDGERVRIKFIDSVKSNNTWQVANQIKMENEVGQSRRYDVTILINGLPLVQIELKKRGIDFTEAINQIDKYRKLSYRKLFNHINIFVVSNSDITKYFSNTDDRTIQKLMAFYWADDTGKRCNTLDEFTASFFNRDRLISILTQYTIMSVKNNKLMVMRPYQIYATERLVRLASETNQWGYVWHTTGSGKTLTSWKCANLLRAERSIAKIFFLIDRKDLDYQTVKEFNNYQANSVDSTDSVDKLKEQIQDDNTRLIVTTMQKLDRLIKKEKESSGQLKRSLEKLSKSKVVFIIDECHRSVFGKTQKLIRQTFPAAQYFGFTGTPRFSENISACDRTTADIFTRGIERMSTKEKSESAKKACLHKYLLKDAIADRNVLGFSVDYVGASKLRAADGSEKKISLSSLSADKRIDLIADYILENHFKKTNNCKYTAMLATRSIDELIKYYDTFKSKIENLGPDKKIRIAAVYSAVERNDEMEESGEDIEATSDSQRKFAELNRIVADYNHEFGQNFEVTSGLGKTGQDQREYDIDISSRIRAEKSPQVDLLIVVNMHLTGFDAPMLNTLYIDKNLEWHNLLQAFSRTNRVEAATKPHGNIVCFRTDKEAVDKSLIRFNDGDSNLSGIIVGTYDENLSKLKEAISNLKREYSTPKAVGELQSEEAQKKFVEAFRDLSIHLTSMNSFVDFGWDTISDTLTEIEYDSYKSHYMDLYRKTKEPGNTGGGGTRPVLSDVDFMIELIANSKIDVDYILNLIKNINTKDDDQRARDIASIIRELNRADSEVLLEKANIIKKFLKIVVPTIGEDESVMDKYTDFMESEKQREINQTAKECNISDVELSVFVMEYDYCGKIDMVILRDKVRERNVGFITSSNIVNRLKKFIGKVSEKYN